MTSNTKQSSSITDAVREMALEVVQSSEKFLVDLQIRGRPGSQVVELFIDGESGVSVDELAWVSRQLSSKLETEDVIKGKYRLNVSSPGSERALRLPQQYKQHTGKTIEIRTQANGDDTRPIEEKGELITSSESNVTLKLESGENRIFTFEEIDEARIVLPW